MTTIWRVYLITCTATGLHYVGQTKRSLVVRWAQHIEDAHTLNKPWPLSVALREHDESAFRIEVIAELETRAAADAREVIEIAARRTLAPHGYNLTEGGPGRTGMKMSDEWRAGHSRRLKATAANGRRWGTNSSEGQINVWRSYTPEHRAARLASSGLHLGPQARHQRKIADNRQTDWIEEQPERVTWVLTHHSAQPNCLAEFAGYLRPQTIIGRIPGLRRVPFIADPLGEGAKD